MASESARVLARASARGGYGQPMGGARGRVVIISARVGAGHDGATEELARRLVGYGFNVSRHDFMELLPGRMGRAALRTYNRVMHHAPWVYAVLFAIGNRPVTAAVTRVLLAPSRRRLPGLFDADVRAVVSTYSLASQLLGPLRQHGRLGVPAITYATDFAVHRHWVAPGVDAHLTPHRVGADQARVLGGRGANAAGALVAPGFRPADQAGKLRARRAFSLPDGPLALVVAGSWGVGRIASTARQVEASGVATPVVVCGRNVQLRRRLVRAGVRYALGWIDDMPTLMQAADVVVENAGGLMALESMACGLPVATYRPIPGHGTLSAAALARAGISTWIRHPRALGPTLTELMDAGRGRQQQAAARELFRTDAALEVVRLASGARPPDPATVHPRHPRTTSNGPRVDAAVVRALAVGASFAAVLRVVGYIARTVAVAHRRCHSKRVNVRQDSRQQSTIASPRPARTIARSGDPRRGRAVERAAGARSRNSRRGRR